MDDIYKYWYKWKNTWSLNDQQYQKEFMHLKKYEMNNINNINNTIHICIIPKKLYFVRHEGTFNSLKREKLEETFSLLTPDEKKLCKKIINLNRLKDR